MTQFSDLGLSQPVLQALDVVALVKVSLAMKFSVQKVFESLLLLFSDIY